MSTTEHNELTFSTHQASNPDISPLELEQLLTQHKKVSFYVHGTCMFPCIHSGDLLQIECRDFSQIHIGDIAVFRRNGKFFGHRVIQTGGAIDRPYLITRPDRSTFANDGPSYPEDVLGVIIKIERHGRSMSLHPQVSSKLVSFLTDFIQVSKHKGHLVLRKWIVLVQNLRVYLFLASKLLQKLNPRFSFAVRIPVFGNLLNGYYREVAPDAFHLAETASSNKPIKSWALVVYLNNSKTIAGYATINWHPQGCPLGSGWHMDKIDTRIRYRHTGLDQKLISRAEEILNRNGSNLQRVET